MLQDNNGVSAFENKSYDSPETEFYKKGNMIFNLDKAKDLFKENYNQYKFIHMIINKYFINDKSYLSFQENLNSGHLALEIQFKFISNRIIYDLNKILENYQINIIKYFDRAYLNNFFKNIDINFRVGFILIKTKSIGLNQLI